MRVDEASQGRLTMWLSDRIREVFPDQGFYSVSYARNYEGLLVVCVELVDPTPQADLYQVHTTFSELDLACMTTVGAWERIWADVVREASKYEPKPEPVVDESMPY